MNSAIKFLFLSITAMTLFGAAFYRTGETLARGDDQAAQSGPSVSSSMDKIVERFRKIIVLLDDDAKLSQEERARCVDVGRKIHQEKQELLDNLSESLTSDLRRAASTRFREKAYGVESFNEYFSNHPGLRDADR